MSRVVSNRIESLSSSCRFVVVVNVVAVVAVNVVVVVVNVYVVVVNVVVVNVYVVVVNVVVVNVYVVVVFNILVVVVLYTAENGHEVVVTETFFHFCWRRRGERRKLLDKDKGNGLVCINYHL